MFQVLAFTLLLGATAPAQNQAELATRLADALANVNREEKATVYVGSLPPGFTLNDALPNLPLIGSTVRTPIPASHPAVAHSRESTTIVIGSRHRQRFSTSCLRTPKTR